MHEFSASQDQYISETSDFTVSQGERGWGGQGTESREEVGGEDRV